MGPNLRPRTELQASDSRSCPRKFSERRILSSLCAAPAPTTEPLKIASWATPLTRRPTVQAAVEAAAPTLMPRPAVADAATM